MHFESFSAFLDMGGYGFYVWLSYGLGFFMLIGLILQSRGQNRQIRQQIVESMTREQRIKQAKEADLL